MQDIDWVAAIVAGLVGYFPGALWYSSALFLKPWAREMGMDLTAPPPRKHGGLMIVLGMIVSLVMAAIFALLIGADPALEEAVLAALGCAAGLIGGAFAIQYLFEGRSLRFWAINAGYHLVQFLLFALILSLWP
jgi:hypothetical protein